jgi:hypothetical protein
MRNAIREAVTHPPTITVGELIDELCRLPDRTAVHFRCPRLEQDFRFYRFRKRSKDVVEIEINTYPESPPVVPSSPSLMRRP